MKNNEKEKLFLKINNFKLNFCLDEATIGLIPSRDRILIILKIIYKEKWVVPAKKIPIWPKKGEKIPLCQKLVLFYMKLGHFSQNLQ